MADLTPSLSRRRPHVFRTQDSNAAWAAAQGLLPIGEGFTAPGYVPAHLVGGIRYSVRSPPSSLTSSFHHSACKRGQATICRIH